MTAVSVVSVIDTPPPEMTGSAARVAHMRNWIEQLEADIARLQCERDTLWKTIAVLDPDGEVPFPPPGKPAVEAMRVAMAAVQALPKPAKAAKPKTRGRAKKAAKKAPTTRAEAPPFSPASIGVSRGRPPLTEIAAVYNAAKADKKATGQAMADHFGVPVSTTNNWPSALRKAGLLNDRGKGRPPGSPNKPKPSIAADAQVTQISSAPSIRTSSSSKPDQAQIAVDMLEFRMAGRPVAKELSIKYHVPESTTRNWMAQARAAGLVPELRADLKVIEDNTIPENTTAMYNAGEVAAFYLQAHRDNVRPLQFVADSFGIDKAAATSWVRQARLDGALPSASEPQLPEEERRKLLEMSKPESIA